MDNESLPLRIPHLRAAGVLLWQCMARSGAGLVNLTLGGGGLDLPKQDG